MLALTHLSDYGIDPSALPVHPDVTTFDSPANHVVGTGTALDGVVELVIDDQNLCTGALLTTRRHILTAAHCIDSATEVDVNFHLAGGLQTLEAEDDNLFVHPDFDIDNLGDGADIGLIALDEEAPAGVASFDIRRAGLTQVSVVDVVGNGVAGQGIEQYLDGNKRDGLNRYELFFDTAQTMIMYDFDNGNSANDAIGIATEGGLANTGLGNDEVLGVGGDSGSPTFLNGVIAGVHSFRTTLQDGEGDAVAGLNGSFGEISVDGLTSAFADWIDSIDDTEGPQVTSAIVGSTEGTSDPDYTVPVSDGDQIQTVPVKRADEFSVVFDKDISIQEADISLVNVDTGNPFSVSGFEYDRSTFTAKISSMTSSSFHTRWCSRSMVSRPATCRTSRGICSTASGITRRR